MALIRLIMRFIPWESWSQRILQSNSVGYAARWGATIQYFKASVVGSVLRQHGACPGSVDASAALTVNIIQDVLPEGMDS
jgi:hypothetical protein